MPVTSSPALPDATYRLLDLVAHELRSPLSACTGYARMLAEGRLGPATEAQQQVLDQLKAALGRAAGLVGQAAAIADLAEPAQAGGSSPLFETARAAVADATGRVPMDSDFPGGDVAVGLPRAGVRDVVTALVDAAQRAHQVEGAPRLVVTGRVDPDGGRARLLVAPAEHLDALAAGPDAPACGPCDIWQGGLGLALVRAAALVDRAGGGLWALAGADARRAYAVWFPVEDVRP